MVVQQIFIILGAIFALGLLLGIFREDARYKYLIVFSFVIALPIIALVTTVFAIFKLSRLFLLLSTMLLKAVSKGVAYALICSILIIIIGLTYFVPHMGRVARRLKGWLEKSIDISELVDECRYARQMMVEIVAEQDSCVPKYEVKEQYQEELIRIKDSGKRTLAVGESVLSLFIGGVLLVSQIYGFQLFQTEFYGFTAAVGFQIGLFIIAISILYRVSILDFLAYTGDEDFSSIDEMDVALTYQKTVSRIGFVELLILMVVLAMRLSNADRETIRKVLYFFYGDKTYRESMEFAWKQLTRKNSGQSGESE